MIEVRVRSTGWVIALLALCAGLVAFAPWGGDDSLRRVQETGVLRVGYTVEAPFVWVGPKGEVSGEGAAIVRDVASRLGASRVEWVQSPYVELVPRLLEKRVDVVVASLPVAGTGNGLLLHAGRHVAVPTGFLVMPGNPASLKSLDDVLRRPLKVAVVSGSREEARLKALGVDEAVIVCVPDLAVGRAIVAAGKADALAHALPALQWSIVAERGRFDIVADAGHTPEAMAPFAFAPAAAALRGAWISLSEPSADRMR